MNPKTQESYIALFNLTNEPQEVEVSVEDCAAMYQEGVFPITSNEVEEIWSGENYDSNANLFKGELPPHGALVFGRF